MTAFTTEVVMGPKGHRSSWEMLGTGPAHSKALGSAGPAHLLGTGMTQERVQSKDD